MACGVTSGLALIAASLVTTITQFAFTLILFAGNKTHIILYVPRWLVPGACMSRTGWCLRVTGGWCVHFCVYIKVISAVESSNLNAYLVFLRGILHSKSGIIPLLKFN